MGNEQSPRAEERLLASIDRLRRTAQGRSVPDAFVVSGPQLTLLEWVGASPGSGITEIAGKLGLTAPTVSVGARRLEDAGLLERQADPQDGRALRLFLTSEGQAMLQKARAFRLDKMRKLLAGLSSEEQEKLMGLLERALEAAEE
ncbi:MAG TPA: MarR family winged helix-turn-helix transcriptional regulator [Anaerolineae bacterium]|nr:MarR family winged helix-turn-helix transcriptional regulator [Anaerolineae bacterium]